MRSLPGWVVFVPPNYDTCNARSVICAPIENFGAGENLSTKCEIDFAEVQYLESGLSAGTGTPLVWFIPVLSLWTAILYST